ncbi:MAG: helix-turn-helix domain-containing protein [Saprospiraceae bacterium]
MATQFLLLPQDQLISRDDFFLEKVRNFILSNLGQRQFGVGDLAKNVHLSVSQLNRKLNALIGRPAGKLIWELRLRYAASLLAHDTGSISEIAHKSGFSDQAHFCRSFKKLFFCTPSQYGKQNRSSFQ